MQTSNPVFRNDPFSKAPVMGAAMTVSGAVWKTSFLLMLAVVSGSATWVLFASGRPLVIPFAVGASFLGFLMAIAISFKPTWAPAMAPVYALVEGVFLGGISAFMNQRYPGIALAAAGGTVATLAAMLFAYQSGLIRATDKFKRGVIAATIGIFIFYMAAMVLHWFGVKIPLINGSGLWSIGFSVFVVVIAALNLVLDFDQIEQGAQAGAPKYMEWYSAFGLMVTLVWLYIEILRLLAKLSDRR
ncbi:MAG: Bax inhibitor-1/YccA family protein [Verrucomicrobiales bacterium]|nr:Bax inhibitor-1/YccA family protein [Verrucomicrobiales bacterium]